MNFNKGNLFAAIPVDISEELFTRLAHGQSTRIERIVSRGQASPASGWYDQADNEWVVVLQGEAQLEFENNAAVHLRAGDYINIPAHMKHKVAWTKPESETVWLAVHYS
ncbi:MAG: cupin domain-containing protein [Xanthomonadales bacterium]|nr:cupin domain-containing protein [Gammaproteobacteria bacterium]MBT8075359.1 cupin domain-containing protein [Gammaproteobacteria bacterium]NNK03694.1 cupin domain-containing protein [Xanthomonadales bacterium]